MGSPVCADMMATAREAKPYIGRWLHLASGKSDRMQWLGELFDGKLGIIREHPLADEQYSLKKAGHAGILTDPALVAKYAPVVASFLKWDVE